MTMMKIMFSYSCSASTMTEINDQNKGIAEEAFKSL